MVLLHFQYGYVAINAFAKSKTPLNVFYFDTLSLPQSCSLPPFLIVKRLIAQDQIMEEQFCLTKWDNDEIIKLTLAQ